MMCQGKDGRWNMVGIISLGVQCSSHPVVTTRVSSYIKYITNVIQEGKYFNDFKVEFRLKGIAHQC